MWQRVKLSDVSLGNRPQYRLVADENVKKPTKQAEKTTCPTIGKFREEGNVQEAAMTQTQTKRHVTYEDTAENHFITSIIGTALVLGSVIKDLQPPLRNIFGNKRRYTAQLDVVKKKPHCALRYQGSDIFARLKTFLYQKKNPSLKGKRWIFCHMPTPKKLSRAKCGILS